MQVFLNTLGKNSKLLRKVNLKAFAHSVFEVNFRDTARKKANNNKIVALFSTLEQEPQKIILFSDHGQ